MKMLNGILLISAEEVLNELFIAIDHLISKDKFLLKANVQERALAFRLAMYLHQRFFWLERHGIFVDVEYNKEGESELKRPDPEAGPSKENTWIAPDIILHERGSARETEKYRNDILYCEIKKNDLTNGSEDDQKIKDQMQRRKYLFGINLYKLTSTAIRLNLYTKDTLENPKGYHFDFTSRQIEEDYDEQDAL